MTTNVEAKIPNHAGIVQVLCALVLLLMVLAMVYAGAITISDYGQISV